MVYTCDLCCRNFDTLKELNIHQSHCKRKNNLIVRCNQIDTTVNINDNFEGRTIQ